MIPRFALSCTDELLASCAALHAAVPGSWLTSHVNENAAEIATVRDLFGCSYVDSYDRHGLVGPRTVLAHNVHPTDAELERLAAGGAAVAHCPTSNAALGSGLFPLDRHLAHRVPVALGSDVGAGTGYSLFKEGLQAYFMQQLRGADGVALTSTASALPGHDGRRGGARTRRTGRRPQRRQALRRALAAPAAGQPAGRRAAPRGRSGAGAGAGIRAGCQLRCGRRLGRRRAHQTGRDRLRIHYRDTEP